MATSNVQAIRSYSTAPVGAARVEVLETTGSSAIRDNKLGTCSVIGLLPRGPVGIPIPVPDQSTYHLNFGDPKDRRWHLDRLGTNLAPDWIDGFWYTSEGRGQLWVLRPDIGGRSASVIIKNRLGGDALKFTAANPGRWGGKKNWVALTPVLVATQRTFTLLAPGVKGNEFAGSDAIFSSVSGRRYRIIGNTEASEDGIVIFTVSSQYSLTADGISGPTALSGTASYQIFKPIDGTVSFAAQANVAGTISINQKTITGVDTHFLSELRVGSNLYYQGEARVVESITSDTTLTLETPFTTATANTVTVRRDNTTLTGTGTDFTKLQPGNNLYVTVNDSYQRRTVRSIVNSTQLVLESGYTQSFTSFEARQQNFVVTGINTAFDKQVKAGQFIIDPNRPGLSTKVINVSSATELVVEQPFTDNFREARITTQNQKAEVQLSPASSEGLFIEIGQGIKYSQTHFSVSIAFNGTRVMFVPDVSMDPEEELYIVPVINDNAANVAYRSGANNYQRWVTVENLWTGSYTTAPGDDVRPSNGSGTILEVTRYRAYTDADFDYTNAIGKNFYPDPYRLPGAYYRIEKAQAPIPLEGSFSSTGVQIIGTATKFLDVLSIGDYLVANGEARKVRVVESDTSVILETRFSEDLDALTTACKAGYLEVGRGYNLIDQVLVGNTFLVQFPTPLTQGYDGNTADVTPWNFLQYLDPEDSILARETMGKNQGLIRLAIPGIDSVAVKKGMMAWAEAYAHEAVLEIPVELGAIEAESYINQEVGRSDFASVCFPSYGLIASPFSQGDRLVPLTGDWSGGQSRLAVDNDGYHFIFAGNRAIMRRITRLPITILPKEEAILNSAGIVPVKTVQGNIVPYGTNSPSISAVFGLLTTCRIQRNIIHMLLEAPSIQNLLFQPNQPGLAQLLRLTLDGYARKEYAKGVFTNEVPYEDAVVINVVEVASVTSGALQFDSKRDALVEIVNGERVASIQFIPSGPLQVLKIYCGPDLLAARFGAAVNQSSV